MNPADQTKVFAVPYRTVYFLSRLFVLKVTVAPDYFGLKVIWLEKPWMSIRIADGLMNFKLPEGGRLPLKLKQKGIQ
jgi:hypothetical protein